MRYLCLCYYDRKQFEALTPAQFGELKARCGKHDAEFHASGKVRMVGSLGGFSRSRITPTNETMSACGARGPHCRSQRGPSM